MNDGLREHRGRRRAVSGDIRSLGRHFAHHLCSHVLHGFFQFNLFGDGHAVFRHRGRTPFLLEHDIAPLGAEGHFDRIGQQINALLQSRTRLRIKGD